MQEKIKPGYIRISQILQQFNDFSAVPDEVLSAKCTLGSHVHAAIEALHEGLYVPLTEREQPYFESFEKWHAVTQFTPHKSEVRLYDDKLKITGCLDAIYERNGKLILVDYKTSASPSESWQYQGMFYWHLAKINGIDLEKRYLFLQFHPNGKPASTYSFDASERTWQTCLNLYYGYLGGNSLA